MKLESVVQCRKCFSILNHLGTTTSVRQTYLCRVSTTPGNTGNLLEFEIPPENTGNLLDFC